MKKSLNTVFTTAIVFVLLGLNAFAVEFDALRLLRASDLRAGNFSGSSPLKSGTGLRAYFINAGQGDAQYIELPNGKNVLIDGGPSKSGNSTVPAVGQFLKDHNVTHLDFVVLTHPHTDHAGGLQYVFDNFQVDSFYDTRMETSVAASVTALRKQIQNTQSISVSYPAAGDSLEWDPGETAVKVFNSCSEPAQNNAGISINNCSIVLKITYQNVSLLYTGDLQEDAEAQLVLKYGKALQADILKVGHHGSKYSSSADFLNMVQPRIAYIEVGAGNPYGHPTQAALSRLQTVGAKVYRTDQDGTQLYTISATRVNEAK